MEFKRIKAGSYTVNIGYGYYGEVYKTEDGDWKAILVKTNNDEWERYIPTREVLHGANFDTLKEGKAFVFKAANKITRPVKNLMSGKIIDEPITTPNFCSVGSEAYWSM